MSGVQNYLDLLRRILDEGAVQQDRTGTGTLSVFGHQMRFDLSKGFPLLTTKKLHIRSIIIELLWFLRGDTNTGWLKENRVSIWDEWADANGDLGPVYGKQWRDWESADGRHVDQIAELLETIRTNPASRRQIVTAWNPGEIHRMALAPCMRGASPEPWMVTVTVLWAEPPCPSTTVTVKVSSSVSPLFRAFTMAESLFST